jgi:hypothetical protein
MATATATATASPPWTPTLDARLIETVCRLQRERAGVPIDELDWESIARTMGKTTIQCASRMVALQQLGIYFATIDEVWQVQQWEAACNAPVELDNWDNCKAAVCRRSPPDFVRLQLPTGDTRNPREFVFTAAGALLRKTTVINAADDSVTTVHDNLIPVDIFGQGWMGADKSHLLPKAREDAITWNYPACAVLGLDIVSYVKNTNTVQKAILGCFDKQQQGPWSKIPGIRNLLGNIIRMSHQRFHYDQYPNVVIFPIYDLEATRAWAGEGYEAIVVCASANVAESIGMLSVFQDRAESASLTEINTAVNLASTICQFLAYSVLQKSASQVNKYQHNGDEVGFHKRFREEKRIKVPFALSELPPKPVFKVSFHGHGDLTQVGIQHPAPDPMLLAFRSCNNWCRKYVGFRMVAAADPEEVNDDLSEEGQQNLHDFLAWQADEEKRRDHDDIMNRFGGERQEGAVARGPSGSIQESVGYVDGDEEDLSEED